MQEIFCNLRNSAWLFSEDASQRSRAGTAVTGAAKDPFGPRKPPEWDTGWTFPQMDGEMPLCWGCSGGGKAAAEGASMLQSLLWCVFSTDTNNPAPCCFHFYTRSCSLKTQRFKMPPGCTAVVTKHRGAVAGSRLGTRQEVKPWVLVSGHWWLSFRERGRDALW